MMMIGDENVDASVSATLIQKTLCKSKSWQNWPLCCSGEPFLKNQCSQTDALKYRLTILCPRGQLAKQYSQIV
jgi:hypothetical protein